MVWAGRLRLWIQIHSLGLCRIRSALSVGRITDEVVSECAVERRPPEACQRPHRSTTNSVSATLPAPQCEYAASAMLSRIDECVEICSEARRQCVARRHPQTHHRRPICARFPLRTTPQRRLRFSTAERIKSSISLRLCFRAQSAKENTSPFLALRAPLIIVDESEWRALLVSDVRAQSAASARRRQREQQIHGMLRIIDTQKPTLPNPTALPS